MNGYEEAIVAYLRSKGLVRYAEVKSISFGVAGYGCETCHWEEVAIYITSAANEQVDSISLEDHGITPGELVAGAVSCLGKTS